MFKKIPWIPEVEGSKFQLTFPIESQELIEFIKSGQYPDGFYISLEETFWAMIGLKKLGEFPETAKKDLITYVMNHRMASGGFTSKIEDDIADLWSTFYAIALLHMAGLFKEDLIDESLFCPECGQKQLFKAQNCFNCGTQIVPEISQCAICEKDIQRSSSSNHKWNNLCDICNEIFSQDIKYVLNLQKQGFRDESNKESYQSTFFAVNILLILKNIDKLNMKKLLTFLSKNQYSQGIERIYQILSYYLLEREEEINKKGFLEKFKDFQLKNDGFRLDKKTPEISDTFWSVIPFYLLKKLDLIKLGPIYYFVSGLKRGDGGYAEQIMGTRSNIISTVKTYLIILMIFDSLMEKIENSILKECLSGNKIYLAPIAEKNSVSDDFVENVANYLFSKEWFVGKIIDQLDFFIEYLEKSNIITQKIGKDLVQIIHNQKPTEIKLNEFSKNFEFENAEERVKTVIIDFLVKKLLEGEIRKIKKHFVFENVNLPRKFIFLEKEINIKEIFEEKSNISPTQELIITVYQKLLSFPKVLEENILASLKQQEFDQAREKLELGINNFNNELNEFDGKLNEILSEFKYHDFKEIMIAFFEEWGTNKKALTLYITKFKNKMTTLITEKEKSKEHEDLLSKEQKNIVNFEEYLRLIIDKIELLSQNFNKFFQQNYKDSKLAESKIGELNEKIKAFTDDLTEKNTQFNESIEFTEIPETINDLKNLLNSKINLLKEIINESTRIIMVRENLPNQLDEKIQNFKEKVAKSRINIINEKIEKKEFESASKELETQDKNLKDFKTTIFQNLEEKIEESKVLLKHFTISFEDFRVLLNKKLDVLENEWNTQKDELLIKFLEKTELSKKNQLENKIKNYINTETEKFESNKQSIENLIRQENIPEAKIMLESVISEFSQTSYEFEIEINDFIKITSKQFRYFRQNVNEIFLKWKKDKDFIHQSMKTLLDQIKNLIAEKELLTQKNKLESIIQNQKLLLAKDFSNLIKHYHDTLQKNEILKQETYLLDSIKNISIILKKNNIQITQFIRENSRKFEDFSNIVKAQMDSWQKESNIIKKTLQRLKKIITENAIIEHIYFVIKAFQGYKVELKYLAKAINMKYTQLKDQLVYFLSNSQLEGNLDPINDMLTLTSLKPITETILSLLKQIKEEIGNVFKIDFEKKEAIPKEIEDKKRNLLQLRYLLIIHKRVGATLFHRKFGTWDINPDLISGFLSAIQSFGVEIKSKNVPIKKMAYNEFEIVINQGELVFIALIVDGKTTKWHEKKLAEFTKQFEKEFYVNLEVWSGELTQFKSTGLMIDRIFELFRIYT